MREKSFPVDCFGAFDLAVLLFFSQFHTFSHTACYFTWIWQRLKHTIKNFYFDCKSNHRGVRAEQYSLANLKNVLYFSV